MNYSICFSSRCPRCRFMSLVKDLFKLFVVLSFSISPILSYIPAQPSNDSLTLNNPSSNSSGSSNPNWIIQLNWQPMGIFSDGVNLQIKADHSNDSIHQGVLLHFTEANSTSQSPVTIPWIAMINCDRNSTNSSNQDDIFTLARDHGAQAAMIYSLNSQTCKVNQEFLDNFEKPLDVFSSGNLQGSRLIESQFSNVPGSSFWFQSDLLNASAQNIIKQINSTGFSRAPSSKTDPPRPENSSPSLFNSESSDSNSSNPLKRLFKRTSSVLKLDTHPDEAPAQAAQKRVRSIYKRFVTGPLRLSIRSPAVNQDKSHPFNINVISNRSPSSPHASPGDPGSPVFLVATLADSQVASGLSQQVPNSSGDRGNQNRAGASNTSLAMVILYAITGFVTMMFLIVIISGAVRALRNPERYGPRPAGRRFNPETGEEDPGLVAPQTRAAGLTKAILDTFPVVKFGRSHNHVNEVSGMESNQNLTHEGGKGSFMEQESIIMHERKISNSTVDPSHEKYPTSINKADGEADEDYRSIDSNQLLADDYLITPRSNNAQDSSSSLDLTETSKRGFKDSTEQIVLEDVSVQSPSPSPRLISSENEMKQLEDALVSGKLVDDREGHSQEVSNELEQVDQASPIVTCPICVCEFEEGDDVRVLPCDARHQFHKECVDPWLLNESRLCPLCRWDLSTRKDGTKILEDADGVDGQGTNEGDRGSQSQRSNNMVYENLTRPSQTSLGSDRTNLQTHLTPSTSSQDSDSSGSVQRSGRTVGGEDQSRQRRSNRIFGEDDTGVTEGEGGRRRFIKYIAQVRRHRSQGGRRR